MDVRVELWESWVPKNWCFWTVVLEKTLESPLDCKEIQPVHSKGDQPRVFSGRNDAEAETPVLWPPHATSWLIGKDSDAGRDWGQEEKGMTEDEMAGWHHRLDGRWVWVNSGSWWWTRRPGVLRFMGSQSWTQLSNWTELNKVSFRGTENTLELDRGGGCNTMNVWHHQINGHEFEQTQGDSEGQASLVCCSLWDQIQLSHWTTCANELTVHFKMVNFMLDEIYLNFFFTRLLKMNVKILLSLPLLLLSRFSRVWLCVTP